MILTVSARRLVSRAGSSTLFSAAVGVGIGLGVAATITLAPKAFAQETSAQAALEGLSDANAQAALRAMIDGAAAKGIPTSPLVTKVREGISKGATPDRIRTATAALMLRLETAAAALAPTRAIQEVSAGADALQTGIPATTLRDMRRVWPDKPLTVPLGVLTELVQSGVPHANATKRVRELLVKGASTAQLAALGTNVRNDIAAGLAPDASMELRSKGVLSQLHSQSLPAIAAPIRPGPPPNK